MSAVAPTVVDRPQDKVIRRKPKRRRDWAKWGLGAYFVVFLIFLYAPMILMAILSFQGYYGGVTFPFRGPVSLQWWQSIFQDQVNGQFTQAPAIRTAGEGSLELSPRCRRRRRHPRLLAVDGVPSPVQGRRDRLLRDHARADGARLPARPRDAALLEGDRRDNVALAHGPRRQHGLGDPVRLPGHGRDLEPLRRPHRRGRPRSRRERREDVRRGDAAARLDRDLRRLPVRLHADVERLRPNGAARDRRSDAPARDRRPDPELGAPARSLRARHGDDGRLAGHPLRLRWS